jgi:hypothetical protein
MVRHFVVIGLSKSAHDATKLSESAETTRHTVDTSIAAAVYGTYVGMAKNRIKRINSAAGGATVVELWGAHHFVFMSNEAEVLREIHKFAGSPR